MSNGNNTLTSLQAIQSQLNGTSNTQTQLQSDLVGGATGNLALARLVNNAVAQQTLVRNLNPVPSDQGCYSCVEIPVSDKKKVALCTFVIDE